MITDGNQRMTRGRQTWVAKGEVIRTSEYDVGLITGAEAAAFVREHHYEGETSPPAHPFGLHHRGELVGVAIFGPLASQNAHRKVFPTLADAEGVTLGRLVLLECVAFNAESFFVARTFEQLAARGVVGVDSCADPIERVLDGRVVKRGHIGQIYQATNGRYIGKTDPATHYLLPDGTTFSKRARSKIEARERNYENAVAKLVAIGAPPLDPAEDSLAWMGRVRATLLRKYRHPGNHRYVWSLDKRRRREVLDRHAQLPYPKIAA